ncbi:TetR/AcrR family transcriptional regulator [Gracilibacillus oryzae]|uniref:TetR/AcrR family transcriptional regulator n=1 Tax=Gracilibacillus oryzae TaxID=1672701 RepID=A0A7C8KRK3_9BACI|nr:TetR/AcrR family transcriptional regulator [Gracilibacillus oryzae]KAB8133603.1 TetR/AcrR family transcriptional regulator [Gracilibacillus oryzae]
MKKSGFELRREAKMKSIEEAAFKLLNQKEIAQITMEEIAKDAGASKVTLFNYYHSKENLVNTTIRNYLTSIMEDYDRLIESELSFEQTYIELTQYKMQNIDSMSAVFLQNVMQQFQSDTSFMDQNIQEITDQLMLRLFQKGRTEGKINPAYSDEVLKMYMHIFTEGLRSKTLNSDHLIEYGAQISQMFMNGLR